MKDPCLIVSIVRKGWGDAVLQATMEAGASGGTVIFGRGLGINEKQRIFGIQIEPEKEVVLTVVSADQSDAILNEAVRVAELNAPGKGLAFVVPIEKVVGVVHFVGTTPPQQ